MVKRSCDSRNCGNAAAPHRKKCNTCRSKVWRRNNPLKATYRQLRENARRRGIPFKLTLGFWKEFCEGTKYLELRGTRAEDMTVDCNDNYIGYVDYGISMKTRRQNAKEGRKGVRPEYRPDGVPF